MTEPFTIFSHAVESLLRAVKPKMTPKLQARLLSAGLDVAHKPLPQYPLASWREFLRICREELYAADTEAEGYRRLGEDFAGAYFQSPFGGALAGVARLLGPVRTLKRATQNWRTANNFSECQVKELGPTEWELWMNHVDQNDFSVGILRNGLQGAGAKDVGVIVSPGPDDSATFRIRWK